VSPRSAQAFVAVNCGAIPDALLEAEFFGYRKGAFTGANEDRQGFFQAAHGGTLFLDEIGELPLSMQSKLLRVIQERAVRPARQHRGTTRQRAHRQCHAQGPGVEVSAQRFRQDLFYRLNVIQIPIPPLRDRLDDLADICAAVIERIARDAGVTPAPVLGAKALERLRRHAFPGNVRELENLLHRALALSGGSSIEADDLDLPDPELHDAEPEPPSGRIAASERPPLLPARGIGPAELPSDLAAHLDEVEREILERALERHRYNRTAAGASLGLSLRQMRYRMARLGVGASDPPDRGDAD
jgi:two-component system response regulator PilR (NtrC family)